MKSVPSLFLLSIWIAMMSMSLVDAFASPRTRRSISLAASSNALSESSLKSQKQVVDLCVIGAGISGLTAAITTAEKSTQHHKSILIIEADDASGGRVRSDYTEDGYILDRGFAVFIEEYPQSKQLLDYDALGLKQFLPGAKVKLLGRDKLASVSDPLRRRRDIFRAIVSPVGSPFDKMRLLPLFYGVMTKSIEELFEMEETDTLTCLKDTYNFSDEFIHSFFAPFLEGIYLAPLNEQSSRMFHFVMKMFTVGSTSLPKGGMQAVADQLESKARNLGVAIQFGSSATSIQSADSSEFLIEIDSKDEGKQSIHARSVVIATDVSVAEKLKGVNLEVPKLPVRSVGCIYYAFRSPAPLADPILILNGEGSQQRNTKDYPVNNVCFPSVVQRSYAPDGYELCSVSILQKALDAYDGDVVSLDAAVRKQLSSWFPECAEAIMDESKWIQKGKLYVIRNAQPVHYGEDGCANIHGGRDCTIFQRTAMPSGLFVCGDHMATSTFNGALETGVNAGDAVAKYLTEQ